VAVNLSAVQLNSRGIITTIVEALAASGLPPQRLELEITESALILDDAGARAALSALRSMGIEIALDDFGMGYSMLSYLRDFPFDKLKIDNSFVAALAGADDAGHRGVFRAIVDLAAALELRTVAEGIDSIVKLDAVRREGCEVVQGYLIARPMPVEEVAAFAARYRGSSSASLS
jgi:EAL domain-containing protein (putative c-di-GMP-specific phosphodiesterase class I)